MAVQVAQIEDDPIVDLKQRHGSGVVSAQVPSEQEALSRQQVYDFLVSERDRVRYCSSLPLTMVVWFLFALTAWTHGNVEQTNRLQGLIRAAVDEIEVDHKISTLDGQPVFKRIGLHNLTTMDEVWTWLSDGFVPLMAGRPETPGVVRNFNQVVRPGIQLRQKRVAGVSCPVSEELRDYFRSECRSLNAKPLRFGPEVNNTGDTLDRAFVAGGGFQMATMSWDENPEEMFFAFLRIDRELNDTSGSSQILGRKRTQELWSLQWMDDATDSMEISVTLFNPEVMVFTHVMVKISFVRGGLVQPTLNVRPLQLIVWKNTGEIVVDILWAILNLFLLVLTFQEVADRPGSCGNKCCGNFWLLVDWTSILVGFALVGYFMVYQAGIDSLDQHVANLPMALSEVELTTTQPPPPRLVESYKLLAESQALAEEGWQAQFQEDLELMIGVKIYHRLGMFWYVSLILFRFFRGFAGQPRIAAIGRTIGKAAADMGHLLIIVTIAFLNLALGGNLLFGPEIEEWSTLEKAAMATISILFGQGDINAMYEIGPVSTIIWGSMYLLGIIIMLTSMITAILIDHHREVRKSCGRAQQTLPRQIWAGVEDFYWKRSYDVRVVLRFLKSRTSPQGKVHKMFPKLKPEAKRIPRIPYDRLIAFFNSEDDGINPPPPPPWAPVTLEQFIDQGIDLATATRIMTKCRGGTTTIPDQEMPVMRLFEEFEVSMGQSCQLMDVTGEELKNWVAERRVDMNNLEPRQKRLEIMSRKLDPAEPMFGLEMQPEEGSEFQALEGNGNSGGGNAISDGNGNSGGGNAISDAPDARMLQN